MRETEYHNGQSDMNQKEHERFVRCLAMERGMKLTPRIFHHPRLPLEADAVRQLKDRKDLKDLKEQLEQLEQQEQRV